MKKKEWPTYPHFFVNVRLKMGIDIRLTALQRSIFRREMMLHRCYFSSKIGRFDTW